MKYTKLFNTHSEYELYINSESAILPNLSWCKEEGEVHYTPSDSCTEGHYYELDGTPSYPETVPASATSFALSFNYKDIYITSECETTVTTSATTATIEIGENESEEARTITSAYTFHDITIQYSVMQEGKTETPYSQRYLTLDVLTGGTIMWTKRNSVTKTISYSINDGEWTSITATSTGTPINVVSGDKVRLKGTNETYAAGKDNCSGFSGGTAYYNVEGNAMSLIGGDDFTGLTSFNDKQWVFHDLFNRSKVVSAENLVLPVTTLTTCCYRAMFANATSLIKAPKLPATTLAESCYWYMFENCAFTKAPELLATTLTAGCYKGMFTGCTSLNYVKCLATTNVTTSNCDTWLQSVAATGTFVKDANTTWNRGVSAIPSGWTVVDDGTPDVPVIDFNGLEIELSCATEGATIYYKLNHGGSYSAYTSAITINANTFIECYSDKYGTTSNTVSQNCVYDSRSQLEYSNQSIDNWTRSGSAVTVPNSVNAIDGHSSSYSKGTFNYETSVNLRQADTTYLWFQHADQSADIYVDDVEVEKHWGGYNAFFIDITNNVHKGTNNIKVALKNNEGNVLAPYNGDFNFNATLGKVKLFTSSYIPSMDYGYDGFHITSTVSTGSATINVATSIPTGATVVCTISGVNCSYTATSASTGNEMMFSTTITNPRLWNGTIDPYLYNVKLEVYHDNVLYHRYERPYGLRFFEYVINQTVNGETYTGFLLNGQPYLLRGVCVHDDLAGKANALNDSDYTQEFNIITELGCNFLRLAHYPHPKEVYDKCDELGIIVQTEAPWVNKSLMSETEDYWTHLSGQCEDMVVQHYNHPCIVFWGVGNEINTQYTNTEEGKNFVKSKIESYRSLIRSLLPNAWVGYTVSHGTSELLAVFNTPTVDWVGGNIYVGWYISQSSNDPTSELNKRITKTITNESVPCAFSEYGAGGTQHCHSDDFMNTTTRGNNPRHDIEYQMWLHEGHIAAIKNKPELVFTSQWQLFDIAVSNRNEGYTICLDGENTSTDDDLRRLNNKGLVERDHTTKKDTFYLYKAWWNPTPFIHICGKDYTKTTSRAIKCYTNATGTATLYVNGTSVATTTVSDYIAEFTEQTFNSGDVIRVDIGSVSDTFTFAS